LEEDDEYRLEDIIALEKQHMAIRVTQRKCSLESLTYNVSQLCKKKIRHKEPKHVIKEPKHMYPFSTAIHDLVVVQVFLSQLYV
jgi:hypothetical protein